MLSRTLHEKTYQQTRTNYSLSQCNSRLFNINNLRGTLYTWIIMTLNTYNQLILADERTRRVLMMMIIMQLLVLFKIVRILSSNLNKSYECDSIISIFLPKWTYLYLSQSIPKRGKTVWNSKFKGY